MADPRLRGLYAITDEHLIPAETFAHNIELALKGGARIVQYRDKGDDHKKQQQQATLLRDLCNHYCALLIINDDIDLAQQVNADGVHIGKDDVSITEVRNRLGEQAVIGVSCYNELTRALVAQQQGASYVAFGSFYSSPTKPGACSASIELLQQAKQQLQIPVCAIGGINQHNAAELVAHNADMIAVVSGLFGQADIRAGAGAFSGLFD